jgi:predicted DNA-binding protein (UPF0251 family)
VNGLDLPPVPYFVLNLVLQLPFLAVLLVRRRDPTPVREVWTSAPHRGPHRGVALAVAYLLVLRAMQLAPVALVAAARESSIVVGAVFGWLVLREPRPARRLVGAVVVLVGIGLIAVGLTGARRPTSDGPVKEGDLAGHVPTWSPWTVLTPGRRTVMSRLASGSSRPSTGSSSRSGATSPAVRIPRRRTTSSPTRCWSAGGGTTSCRRSRCRSRTAWPGSASRTPSAARGGSGGWPGRSRRSTRRARCRTPSGDDRLAEAMNELSPDDAEVLRLWAWEQLGAGEIAAVLDVTANAASIRLHRAKDKLRTALRKVDAADGHEGTTEGGRR